MKKPTTMLDFILCVIALAIGAMVVILAVINRIDQMLGVMLLGVSTCCIGLSLLDTETPIKQIRARSKKRK